MVFTDDRRVFPVCLGVLGIENVPAQLPRAPCEPVVEPREVLRCVGEIESHVRLDSQLDAIGAGLEMREAQEGIVHARHGLLQVRGHAFVLLLALMLSIKDASKDSNSPKYGIPSSSPLLPLMRTLPLYTGSLVASSPVGAVKVTLWWLSARS